MNERDALARFVGGDAAAFDELVERHERPLMRFATHLLGCPESAQDVVQECFLRLLRQLPRHRPELPLSSWLFRVCRNLCRDHQRKESRMEERHSRVAIPEITPPEPALFEHEEAADQVRRLLGELPPDEREVLLLKVHEGRSYREIAAVTGLTLHAVGKHMHRGLAHLSSRLRAAGLLTYDPRKNQP